MEKSSFNIIQYLSQLEVSQTEAILYLKLLELGSTTMSGLSRKSGIPRTTVYLNVDKLIEKGLISQSTKNNRKYIIAEPPSKIAPLITIKKSESEQKAREVTKLENEYDLFLESIKKNIPSLNKDGKVTMRYLEGKKGIRMVYREAFTSTKLRSYVNLGRVYKFFPDNRSTYLETQKSDKTRKVLEIIDNSKESIRIAREFARNSNFSYRIDHTSIVVDNVDTLIYDNKVVMVNFNDPITASVMENTDYYIQSKNLFDHVWKSLSKDF